MRLNRFGALIAFLSLALAAVVAFFRRIAGDTARLDAADREAEKAKAKVEEAKAEVGKEEQAAALVHAEVEERLADLDRHIADERKRDSVDVANDIIGGK
jgi:hypothetical protein